MLGVILVVSGPTVVGPLLGFVRPTERLQRILVWEGSLIDPVGGILGALVFHAIMASSHKGLGSKLGQFAVSVGVGVAGGAVGAALLWLLLRKLRLGEVLGTTAQLASVIAVAAVCDGPGRTPGSSRRSSWGWRWRISGGSTSRRDGRSSRYWCS